MKARLLTALICSICVAALSVRPSCADEAKDEPPREQLMWLADQNVKKELELTEGQLEAIKAAETKRRDAGRNGGQLGNANKAYDKEVYGLLTPAQKERLWQTNLQLRGIAVALKDARVSKQLVITKEQTAKVANLKKEYSAKVEEIEKDRSGAGDFKKQLERQENIKKVVAEYHDKVKQVLTSDQQAQLDKLLGPKTKAKLMGDRGDL